ncbi:lytic transglycosylase domain-containing protein [Clostridium sp. MSJ-4]|uniref:Lytic transglycosylase domain-containing protein n=1 Tax=Clostridium simiarum TaxID=2841506 RepID=A0ABS6F3C3_9CLOT|nr:lytic transglycosylase domain-containing protein [Clostridium simiarum]MBU5592773.1 lytic transglycosylase domain-containing protein [Clostridium simiarum]
MKSKVLRFSIFILIFFIVVTGGAYIVKNVVYPYKYQELIEKYSEKYVLDPLLVAAVIKTESNFRKEARSNKDAVGLMQITEDTAKWAAGEMNIKDFDVKTLTDPELNIRMGCWYLDNLKKEFNGDMDLVLASYNGGRGNVQKWLKSKKHSKDGKSLDYIPFKETDKYLKRIKVNYNIYKFLYKNSI